MGSNNDVKYAGFWIRFFAFIIDALILAIPMKVIESIVDMEEWFGIIISMLVLWAYYGYLLYRWRGTVGKRLLGLEVLNYDLTPITLQRASFRFVYSLLTYTVAFAPLSMLIVLAFVDSSVIYGLYLILLLPILMIFMTDKKQVLHDYFAKTIVVDVGYMLKHKDFINKQNKKVQIYIMTFLAIVILIILGYGVYELNSFSSFPKDKALERDNSYHITYKTNNYNDDKIIFYQKELDKYSKEFIDAEEMYDIFRSRVKYGISLDCIGYFLQKHTNTWSDNYNGMRRNARNKYANSSEMIKKAKANEDYLFRYEDVYQLNRINRITDEYIIQKDNNQSVCEQTQDVESIYKKVIKKYLDGFSTSLDGESVEWFIQFKERSTP